MWEREDRSERSGDRQREREWKRERERGKKERECVCVIACDGSEARTLGASIHFRHPRLRGHHHWWWGPALFGDQTRSHRSSTTCLQPVLCGHAYVQQVQTAPTQHRYHGINQSPSNRKTMWNIPSFVVTKHGTDFNGSLESLCLDRVRVPHADLLHISHNTFLAINSKSAVTSCLLGLRIPPNTSPTVSTRVMKEKAMLCTSFGPPPPPPPPPPTDKTVTDLELGHQTDNAGATVLCQSARNHLQCLCHCTIDPLLNTGNGVRNLVQVPRHSSLHRT